MCQWEPQTVQRGARRFTLDRSSTTLSVPEAGRRLGVGRCKSYELARLGLLPVLRLGKKLRVPVVAMDQMMRDAYQPASLGRSASEGED